MKPRLDSARLTPEDGQILANWIYRHSDPIWHVMLEVARSADRRDADLMLCMRIPCLSCDAQEWHTFEIDDGKPLLGELLWLRCHVCDNIKSSQHLNITSCA